MRLHHPEDIRQVFLTLALSLLLITVRPNLAGKHSLLQLCTRIRVWLGSPACVACFLDSPGVLCYDSMHT